MSSRGKQQRKENRKYERARAKSQKKTNVATNGALGVRELWKMYDALPKKKQKWMRWTGSVVVGFVSLLVLAGLLSSGDGGAIS